jgi:Xaa-Pro aminopeptidase
MATREFIEKHENLSEYDVAKNLEENFYKFGAKSLSFKSIVAKDQNSALAHYSKSSKTEVLTDGSLVLIDCGAYYEGGYATDCTRVFVKGTPSKLQQKIYTTVLKGFLKAFNKKITPNTSGFCLDKAARTVLLMNATAGFNFSHSLGHGLGISVHESPPSLAFSPTAKSPLKPNMCFTIEPGLYNPKLFGIRLENSCYLEGGKEGLIIKSFTNMCFEKKLIDFDLLTQTEKKQLKFFEVK